MGVLSRQLDRPHNAVAGPRLALVDLWQGAVRRLKRSEIASCLRMVHFDAEQQRCLFHKLQNIYNAIEAPEHLSPKQRRLHKKAIFKDFREIWEAKHYQTMLRR